MAYTKQAREQPLKPAERRWWQTAPAPLSLLALLEAAVAISTVAYATAHLSRPAPCLTAVSRPAAAASSLPTGTAAGLPAINGSAQSDLMTNPYNPLPAATAPLQSGGSAASPGQAPLQAGPGLQNLDPSQL
jgi:hypothetical protein